MNRKERTPLALNEGSESTGNSVLKVYVRRILSRKNVGLQTGQLELSPAAVSVAFSCHGVQSAWRLLSY